MSETGSLLAHGHESTAKALIAALARCESVEGSLTPGSLRAEAAAHMQVLFIFRWSTAC